MAASVRARRTARPAVRGDALTAAGRRCDEARRRPRAS